MISFTISNVYCSNNIIYFNIYNNGNVPININNSQIIFIDNNGNNLPINGSNIICNNGNIIPIGSNSLCYIENYICSYSYIDYITTTNFVYNGISYNYNTLSNKFIIHAPFYTITLYNTQNSPTPQPFQQDIAICDGNPNLSSSFAYVNNPALLNLINSDGSNVYFSTANNSTPNIYSWYEGQLNYNGVICDVWWINLPNGISANGNVTIYMHIGPNSANYYSQYYPYISASPNVFPSRQYDNGDYVFLFYDNFAGTSLNTSKWNYGYDAGGSITVNNGLTINYTSSSLGAARIISKYNFSQSRGVVWYSLMNFYGTSNFSDVRIRIYFWNNNGNWKEVLGAGDYGYFTNQNNGPSTTQLYWSPYGFTPTALPPATSQNDYNILMIQILNSTGLVWNTYTITNNNISLFQSFSQNGTVSGNFSILLASSQDGLGYASIVLNVEYTFLAAAPPNGIMPSIYIS